jgi:hypothetical protein
MKSKQEKTIYDYWLWKKYFSLPQIKQLTKLIEANIHGDESPEKAATGTDGKQLKFLNTRHVFIHKLYKFLKPLLKNIYYINDREFQWDLFTTFDDFELANYNIYSSKTKDHYGWHTDTTDYKYNFDTKFTILINLSDKPYKGGDFLYFQQAPTNITDFKNTGAVLMFKSHLNHQVTPVTSGIRKTLTIFINGPRFR